MFITSSTFPVRTRFTGWSLLAGVGEHFRGGAGSNTPSAFSHSRFAGGKFTAGGSVALTNCVWERVALTFDDHTSDHSWSVFNNLFVGGALLYRARGYGVHAACDNLFDQTPIAKIFTSDNFTHGNNGYVSTAHLAGTSTGGDKDMVAPADYQTGPLGKYYYPPTGGKLSQLIDAGSTTANALGLCPFTVRNDQTPDGISQVDIGFHYVALDAQGNPQDNNFNGIPDYDETPVATPQTVQPCRNTALPITLTGSGNNCGPLTFIIVSGPTHGSLGNITPINDTSAGVTYTTASFCGEDSFSFKVRNNGRDSAPATITINVGDPNPVANCQDVMTGKNTPVPFTLTGSDTCNDTLTFTVVNGSGPNSGTLSGSGATRTYTPSSSTFEGTDGFDFTVSNCGFSSASTHVTINVVPGPVLTVECREDRIFLGWIIPAWVEQAGLADEFQIYRCDSASGSCTPTDLYATTSGSARAFLDASVVANRNYCYKIQFRHTDVCNASTTYESPFSNVACSSICPPPPPPPCVIRSGFDSVSLDRNDDNRTGDGPNGDLIPNLLAPLPFDINFFGTTHSSLYVNNNGNVTFDDQLGAWIPETLVTLGRDIIAPFWADVDTRNAGSDVVRYGNGTVSGHSAFGVNWVNVGYYQMRADKLLSVQLVLIDRSDLGAGFFDMEFNYCKVRWEAGIASGGIDGIWVGPPPSPARAGFASAAGSFFEFTGSGFRGAFLDSNIATGLIYHSFNSTDSGRYVFQFRSGGIPLQTP